MPPSRVRFRTARHYLSGIEQVFRFIELARPDLAGIEPYPHEIPDFIVRAVCHVPAELVAAEHQAEAGARFERLLELHGRARW